MKYIIYIHIYEHNPLSPNGYHTDKGSSIERKSRHEFVMAMKDMSQK